MNLPSYDFIVPVTLYALLLLSVLTWTIAAWKLAQQLRAGRSDRRFKSAFWTAPSLQAASELPAIESPVARLAQAGLQTLRDADQATTDLQHTGDRQDLLERALRHQIQKERRTREGGLAILASIGSTSPFVGLFGTVWGIMHALTEIGRTGAASLEVVAGPIGEALIATGIGIAVAVPSVLAYNYFLRQLKLSASDLDDFAEDLISLARKSGFRLRRAEPRAFNEPAHGALPSPSPGSPSGELQGAFA